MSGRWWRAYDEAVDDPKLQRLPLELFRTWFNLMCIASQHEGVLPPVEDLAFRLRMPVARTRKALDELMKAGLIDETETGLGPHNWAGRQFKSDVSNERVKRHRDKKRNAECNVTSTVTVTPPYTETDTEQTSSLRSDERASAPRARASRLAADWSPDEVGLAFAVSRGLTGQDLRDEIEKFRNHWTSKAGRDAAKLDWPATWRTWVLNWSKFNGKRPGNDRATSGHNPLLAGFARVAARSSGYGGMAGAEAEEIPRGRHEIDG